MSLAGNNSWKSWREFCPQPCHRAKLSRHVCETFATYQQHRPTQHLLPYLTPDTESDRCIGIGHLDYHSPSRPSIQLGLRHHTSALDPQPAAHGPILLPTAPNPLLGAEPPILPLLLPGRSRLRSHHPLTSTIRKLWRPSTRQRGLPRRRLRCRRWGIWRRGVRSAG